MASVRTAAKAYNERREHVGMGPWITVIHEVNRIDATHGFGKPDSTGDWWAGGYVEEYPDFRVLFRTDDTVSIVSKTDKGHELLLQAAKNLDIVAQPS